MGVDFNMFFLGSKLGRGNVSVLNFSSQKFLDQKSMDYNHIKDIYRPSHADFTYDKKYGIRDYRGGGRSSARETACRVVAGAIAKQLLKGIKITAYVSSVGKMKLEKEYAELDFSEIEKNPVRCADAEMALKMEKIYKIHSERGRYRWRNGELCYPKYADWPGRAGF